MTSLSLVWRHILKYDVTFLKRDVTFLNWKIEKNYFLRPVLTFSENAFRHFSRIYQRIYKKKIIVNVGRQLYTLPENLKKIGAKLWPWECRFQKMQNYRYDVIKFKILKSMAIQILQISIKMCVQSFIKIGTLVLYQEKYNWKNRQIKVGLHVFFPKIRLKLFLFNQT